MESSSSSSSNAFHVMSSATSSIRGGNVTPPHPNHHQELRVVTTMTTGGVEESQNHVEDMDDDVDGLPTTTLQLQSPGGTTHFVKGLILGGDSTAPSSHHQQEFSHPGDASTNGISLTNSYHRHGTEHQGATEHLQHHHLILQNNRRDDGRGEAEVRVGGEFSSFSGQVGIENSEAGQTTLQMVRIGTGENGEMIIFVQPKQEGIMLTSEDVADHASSSTTTLDQTPLPHTLPVSFSQDKRHTQVRNYCHNTLIDDSLSSGSNNGMISSSAPRHLPLNVQPGSTFEFIQTPTSSSNSMTLTPVVGGTDEEELDTSGSSDEDVDEQVALRRRCVVCLRHRKFTQDLYDSTSNGPQYNETTSLLLVYLGIQVESSSQSSGVCLNCLTRLQDWHTFRNAIIDRHQFSTTIANDDLIKHPLKLQQSQFYKHCRQIEEVKEIYRAATHSHYARRNLSDKDWDIFCDGLAQMQTDVNYISHLKRFMTCRSKLSRLLCTICGILIPRGRKGYSEHMRKIHHQSRVLYACDICGKIFPDKVVGSLLVDYFEHWVSHFHEKNAAQKLPLTHLNGSSDTGDAADDASSHSTNSKGPKRSMSAKRRDVCYNKVDQMQNLVDTSQFLHFVRRDFDDECYEYIAERLLSTKSNTSNKIKEIESVVFSPERFRFVFCEECRKTVPGGKEAYYEHRRTVHNETNDDYAMPCEICGEFFPEKDLTGLSQNYFSHWITHFYFEECTTCGEKFPNPFLLKKHSTLHENRPGYPCPQCDKVLSSKVTLDQHSKTHLPDDEKRKHTCHLCGKTVIAPNLKAHMYSVHSDERPWKCEVCGTRFKHKTDLNSHRNSVHLKIKNFTCAVCGKQFGHQCALRVHAMAHEDKRDHKCPHCEKRFVTPWHLKKHLPTHKDEKNFPCPTCRKDFKTPQGLRDHKTIHTGEKRYECHICHRKFRLSTNLSKHFILHKKNNSYYSKKDGLPDPLDAYIEAQRNKKSTNQIVHKVKNAASVALSTAPIFASPCSSTITTATITSADAANISCVPTSSASVNARNDNRTIHKYEVNGDEDSKMKEDGDNDNNLIINRSSNSNSNSVLVYGSSNNSSGIMTPSISGDRLILVGTTASTFNGNAVPSVVYTTTSSGVHLIGNNNNVLSTSSPLFQQSQLPATVSSSSGIMSVPRTNSNFIISTNNNNHQFYVPTFSLAPVLNDDQGNSGSSIIDKHAAPTTTVVGKEFTPAVNKFHPSPSPVVVNGSMNAADRTTMNWPTLAPVDCERQPLGYSGDDDNI